MRVQLEDASIYVEIIVKMINPGRPRTIFGPPEYCDPPEDPEFEIDEINLTLCDSGNIKIEITEEQAIELLGSDSYNRLFQIAMEQE